MLSKTAGSAGIVVSCWYCGIKLLKGSNHKTGPHEDMANMLSLLFKVPVCALSDYIFTPSHFFLLDEINDHFIYFFG